MPNVHNDDAESLRFAVEDEEPDFDVEPEYEQFTLTIRIEGSELRGEDDEPNVYETGISRMLRQVASDLWAPAQSGNIRDINGNTVGRWELT